MMVDTGTRERLVSRRKSSKLVILTFSYGYDKNEVSKMIIDNSADIVALQETWRHNISQINGYQKLHFSAMDSQRYRGRPFGGAGFYVKNSIPFRPLTSASNHMSLIVNDTLNST